MRRVQRSERGPILKAMGHEQVLKACGPIPGSMVGTQYSLSVDSASDLSTKADTLWLSGRCDLMKQRNFLTPAALDDCRGTH